MEDKNEREGLLFYEFEQYKLQSLLKKDLEVAYRLNESICEIVETCKDQCIEQLENKMKEYDEYKREQYQQDYNFNEQQAPHFQQIESYEDEQTLELKKAINSMDQAKLWCSINEVEQDDIEFPEYIIPLYKKLICLLIIDVLLITLICLFMPKFSMNIINDRVTTDIKVQFVVYWITSIIFFGSLIYLFSTIKLFRLRIAVGASVINILWHLLLIIINYSNQSSRQKLFPTTSDAFYFIEFFINIILFIALLIFSARINAIAIGQSGEQDHELLQINGGRVHEDEEFQDVNNKSQYPLQKSEALAKSQILKSQRYPQDNQINGRFTDNQFSNRITQKPKAMGGYLDVDKNCNNYMNDTLSKLNETKNLNFEDTIYVNQQDLGEYSQMNYTINEKPDNEVYFTSKYSKIQIENILKTQQVNQRQGNQIFTITNQFQTEENPTITICHVEDNKFKKIHKPNQVYPIKDSDLVKKEDLDYLKQPERVNESAFGGSSINQETQEKSISRVTSGKNINSQSLGKSLYKKDQVSQKTLTTKSTQNNLLDTTADRSLNLTNKQLLSISRIQAFQTNKSNLNNQFIKHQYDMNYWGSQFCEYSPAIKIRRTIEKYNIDIPPSIEEQKVQELDKLRREQIKKQEEDRIRKMQISEQELQKQIEMLQLNQDELRKKHEKELAEKLKEKEENERKLQEELNNLILESERKEKEAKEREEQDRYKKLNEVQSKKSAVLLVDPSATIQEEEEQNNSSLIQAQNKLEESSNKESPTLQRDNPNGQSKSKKQFKVASNLKINPSIIEEEDSEKEQNYIVFDDDYHNKDTDQYIDINTFVKKSIAAPNSTSLSQFPLSVLKENDQQSQAMSIDEEEYHLKELTKLKDLQNSDNKNVSNSINSSSNINLNDKDYTQNTYQISPYKSNNTSGNQNMPTINSQANTTDGSKNKSYKENSSLGLDNYATLQQKDNNRYSGFRPEEGSNTIDITQGIGGEDSSPNKKHNGDDNRLNQTVNSFYVSKSNTQSGFFDNGSNPQKRLQNQTISDTRKSENLQKTRPNTSNSPVPILNLNNFNRGTNQNNKTPNVSNYQSAVNRGNPMQNLDSHREMQRQNLIKQAENFLNSNNYSRTGTPAIKQDGGSSRMELIGQDDLTNSPDQTSREQNPFRILEDYKMKIIGVNDFDEDILNSITQPEHLSRDYSKSEYQKMKQMFSRGQSNSKLQTHHLKQQQGAQSILQQKIDDNQNVIL